MKKIFKLPEFFFLRVNSIFKDNFCLFFMGLVSFWRYPDPVPYRLKRIRIRPNDTDPDLDPDPNHCYKERVISAFVINSFK